MEEIIEVITNKVNELYDCYYDEAPDKVTFPFIVMNDLDVIPLNVGFQTTFSLYVMNNESSKVITEKIQDDLRKLLDRFNYVSDQIGFHVGYDGQQNIRDIESDLIIRKVTFIVRSFEK